MNEVSADSLNELIRQNQIVLTRKQKAYLKVKRIFDFCFSLLALIVLSPVLLAVAIAIKLDSPNEKVIFKQERVGQNGKRFMLYKFRSMKKGTPELKTSEFVNAEQYITKVGKFIRKTSLDELPQLYSVMVGDMSLVGSRPLILSEDEVHYLRKYYGIYQLKPGITGLAQINGRDTMGDYEKVRWDRAYVRNVSPLMDFYILVQTVPKVLKRENVMDETEKKIEIPGHVSYVCTEKIYDDKVHEVNAKF